MSFTHLDKSRFLHKKSEKYRSDMQHLATNGRVKNIPAVQAKIKAAAAIVVDYDYLHGTAKQPGTDASLARKLEWIDEQKAGYSEWFARMDKRGFSGRNGREGAERVLRLWQAIYNDYASGAMCNLIPELT